MNTGVAPLAADTAADVAGLSMTRIVDRWIYVFMAAFFIVIVLTGFIPDSFTQVAAVEAGQRPPFPLALHVHAVLMGSFLLLLLAQTILMATGRRAFHMQLGIAGAGVAAALVVAGIVLVPMMYHQLWNGMQGAPPEVQAGIQSFLREFDNIILMQIRIGLLFPLFIAIALLARKSDPGLHKRMMFLAIVIALPAAFDRMTWLPNTMPTSSLAAEAYILLVISPMLVWDIFRTRTIHRAYLIWGGVYLVAALVVHSAWDKEWWHEMAPRLMGV